MSVPTRRGHPAFFVLGASNGPHGSQQLEQAGVLHAIAMGIAGDGCLHHKTKSQKLGATPPKTREKTLEVKGPCLEQLSGNPQTCVYHGVCLGIGDVSGKAPLPGQGAW